MSTERINATNLNIGLIIVFEIKIVLGAILVFLFLGLNI